MVFPTVTIFIVLLIIQKTSLTRLENQQKPFFRFIDSIQPQASSLQVSLCLPISSSSPDLIPLLPIQTTTRVRQDTTISNPTSDSAQTPTRSADNKLCTWLGSTCVERCVQVEGLISVLVPPTWVLGYLLVFFFFNERVIMSHISSHKSSRGKINTARRRTTEYLHSKSLSTCWMTLIEILYR
jgi:hypothetical protein